MTAVALIMLNIGILMVESALAGNSIQDAANAIINGQPINFTPMPTQANQQTATGNQKGATALTPGISQTPGVKPL